MKIALAATALAAALAIAAPASARTARCVVTSADGPTYSGPCGFVPDKGGSFGIEPLGRRHFPSDATSITVWIVEPGLAEVRGLTPGGINSRWGEARRSKRDRACWYVSCLRICVY